MTKKEQREFGKLQAQIETLKSEKKALENKIGVLTNDRVNRKAKDSVFLSLFSYPENSLQLYKELCPYDTTITEADIQLVTIENVLATHSYNALGLFARHKLILLAEAQSTWSDDIIYVLPSYYFDAVSTYFQLENVDPYNQVKVPLPEVEAVVIYTGKTKIGIDTISLRETFYGGREGAPDFTARVIHSGNLWKLRQDGAQDGVQQQAKSPGIIEQYIGFCRVWDDNALEKNDPEEKQKAVATAMDISIEKGYLVDYLKDHRPEVEKIMITMLSPEYIKSASDRAERIKAVISFARRHNFPEQAIKADIIDTYNLSPQYAQNFLDYVEDPDDDGRPEAI